MGIENTLKSINLDDGFEASKEVIGRKNQDGTVVLMKLDESNLFFKIDGIAAAVWSEMTTKKTAKELIQTFSDRYKSHIEQLEKDIPALLSDLLARKLVVKV